MQTATELDRPTTPPHPNRGKHAGPSRTTELADRRTRELARAMARLEAEGAGGATYAALRREGFSPFELKHYADVACEQAATLAAGDDLRSPPPLSDDELVARTLPRALTALDGRAVARALAGAIAPEDLRRVWPKLMGRLAGRIGLEPYPGDA